MDHVAIDLGGRESQICVRSDDGTVIEEIAVPTTGLRKYLARRAKSRVVVETCTEAFAVADAAREAGHEAVVVPSSLVRALGVGDRGMKNDVRDARNLSEASCRMAKLPSVHVPTAESRRRKTMCGMREALVQARTKLVNTVRAWLRNEGFGIPRTGSVSMLPHRLREHVKKKTGGEVPAYVARHLQMIELLTVQAVEAEAELEVVAKEDQTCQRLMTVPGVGPLTAIRFVAAVDDVARFPNAHRLESYLGLTPGEDSSSRRERTTGITKAGATKLRWMLIQAAWSARRSRASHPMVTWSLQVEGRRGKRVAITALARKIAGILYAIWRDRSTYQREHGLGLVEP